jgi:hypothetical protein
MQTDAHLPHALLLLKTENFLFFLDRINRISETNPAYAALARRLCASALNLKFYLTGPLVTSYPLPLRTTTSPVEPKAVKASEAQKNDEYC